MWESPSNQRYLGACVMRKGSRVFGILVIAVGLFLLPAPSGIEPSTDDGPQRHVCGSLGFGGSVSHAELNPDQITGTLDLGAISCTGKPRNC